MANIYDIDDHKIGSCSRGDVRDSLYRLQGRYSNGEILDILNRRMGIYKNGEIFTNHYRKIGSYRNGVIFNSEGIVVGTYDSIDDGVASAFCLLHLDGYRYNSWF